MSFREFANCRRLTRFSDNPILFSLLLLALLATPALAENFLSSPEAMAYDEAGQRFLVSNYDGTISSIASDGEQELLFSGLGRCSGAIIVDGVFYTNCGRDLRTIKGFSLLGFTEVFSLEIEQATYLNDFEVDETGRFLFVSDFHVETGEIYKVDLEQKTFSVFTDKVPHFSCGMSYEPENNRLVVQSGRSVEGQIVAVSLTDQSISVLYKSTEFGGFDCLKRDQEGNYYLSSWRAHAVMFMESNFSNPIVVFTDGFFEASGIEIIEETKQIAVLSFYENNIDYLPMPNSNEKVDLNVSEIIGKSISAGGKERTKQVLENLEKRYGQYYSFDSKTLDRVSNNFFRERSFDNYVEAVHLNFNLYPESRTPEKQLECSVLKGDGEEVEELEKSFLKGRNDGSEDLLSEDTINEMGYRFIGLEKLEEAIQLFSLNSRLFPNSANAFDSLAEAYMTAGMNDQAISNYRKSLELNPDNQNAKEMLAKLQS